MKKTILCLLLILFANSGLTQTCNSLEQIEWMLGTWQLEKSERFTSETWIRVSDNTFEGVGASQTASGKFVETLRIVKMAEQIFYIAKTPGNLFPVGFELKMCGDKRAVFENAKHDFPQKLDYQLVSNDTLKIVVSSKENMGFTLTLRAKITQDALED